jgi:AraC-like DNA-binding protein
METETGTSRITEYQAELAALIERHTISDGTYDTAVPSLSFQRITKAFELEHDICVPSLLVIAQGARTVMLVNESYRHDLSSYLVASVQLPVSDMVVEATPQKPYLCLRLCFNMDDIRSILRESVPRPGGIRDSKRGMYLNRIDGVLLDAVLRLARLLDTPRDIPVLSPLYKREILYRLLQDSHGDTIMQFAQYGSHEQRIARVINIINRDFAKPLRVEFLAREVGMSVSALNSQFKKVAVMTPLQYQKQIRLQKARRLLLSESMDAASVAFQVGYENLSQFCREYARMFGLPPFQDIKQIRTSK